MRPFSLLLGVFFAGSALAQRTTATLYGIVQDSSSGLVAAAKVRLTNDATAASVETISNERGEFTLSFLPPGVYTLDASVPGFRSFRRTAVRLDSGQQIRFVIDLEVGANAEQITVTSQVSPVQDASPTLNDRLSQQQITELPQVRRDFT